jgi:heterodisulfide reductase subunit A-like polyferredoxin
MMTAIPDVENIGAVLVCGAGVAGIQSSLDLAQSGFKVYLVDSSPAIGGLMPLLDKTFPTGDCAMCILSPKLVECARNRNIEIITLADVRAITGKPGNFKVKIRRNPRYIDEKKCDACGDCAGICPVNLPNEFDRRLVTRKAVFRPFPQAIPNVFTISKSAAPTPCKGSCPAGVNVQGCVALVAAGKFSEAYDLLRRRSTLPAACGRVCDHPCEDKCNRNEIDDPVAINGLERFVADFIHANPDRYPDWKPSTAKSSARVAVVGGGPAGLTAAADLALKGYGVTLFEARPHLGGMLRYGIPAYRLPRDILEEDIRHIAGLGVDVKTGMPAPRPKALLKKSPRSNGDQQAAGEFDAVFVATGAWAGRKLNIPGEDAPGVREGLRFLDAINNGEDPAAGPNVLVIGASNVAVDAARSALRVAGVESVHLACLESREEMPARSDQVTLALEEGVVLHSGLGPTKVVTRGEKVTAVNFRACTSVYDDYKRFDPIFDDSRISSIPADTVIVAFGRGVDASGFGLELRPGGRIRTDRETLATSVNGIFAGGDAVLGAGSIADAMAQGHRAADAIDAYIRGAANIRSAGSRPDSGKAGSNPEAVRFAANPMPDAQRLKRVSMPRTDKTGKPASFDEINLGYGREQALLEAGRCLSCGLCSECLQCEKVCSAGAVCHDQQTTETEIEVGSVILAPGLEEFRASLLEEYGHGRHPDVLTGVQFERMLSATGPTGGSIRRISDGGPVKSIAFIQCVGSRDPERGHGYCASVCCMSAAKEAISILEQSNGGKPDVSIFGMDVRACGKEFDGYIDSARNAYGVKYVDAAATRVIAAPENGSLRVCFPDGDGGERQEAFDLVVLSTGLQVSADAGDMIERLGLERNDSGFVSTNRLSPMDTTRPGIYIAGAFQEPKDISESVTQASASAARAMRLLTTVRNTMIQRHEYPWERDVSDELPRVGVFVCHCGHNIASVVDVEAVSSRAGAMTDVCYAEACTYACSDSVQQHIKEVIRKYRLNRLVVASCWSRTHEVLFQETLRESGLNPYLFAMTNIRDHCAWVHRDDPAAATAKAVDLVGMAVVRARRLKALGNNKLVVTPSALVLGGGLAGMTAALNIADQGYRVHLIEKEAALGGTLRNIHRTLEGNDVRAYLDQLAESVGSHPKIDVYRNAGLTRISGQVGNFTSIVDISGREQSIEHGVVIVATGGKERPTGQFLNGVNPKVITQGGLEAALFGGSMPEALSGNPAPTIVMIQCVESRDEKNPYCSRVCCAEAIKNALEIKRRLPQSDITILARDIRTPGFRELFFRKAIDWGVRIIYYSAKKGPAVVEKNGELQVTVQDRISQRDVTLRPDLLALSTGISPASGNRDLSGMLRSSLTADGFFQEAHPKLRPVDLANEGEFLCGLSHSPRFMDETIAQAQAAAARAARILSKAELEIAGQVARVNPASCVACATCIKVCPYGAPMINAVKKSEIRGAKCMGCGSCVAACPSRSITLQHQESRVMVEMLDELLAGGGRA